MPKKSSILPQSIINNEQFCPNLNKYECIIWDWNGTLYNDVFVGMDTVNEMLIERGLTPMTLDRYREIFTFPIVDYYREVGFDFGIEPYEKLAAIFIEKNNKRLGESYLYEGAITALEALKSRGLTQLILSATRQDILIEQVKLFGIEGYFEYILGKKDFYAYGKSEIASEWLKQSKADPQRVLLIGDTTHDYEVASHIGCDCILIASGHQSKARLKTKTPKVIDSITQLH